MPRKRQEKCTVCTKEKTRNKQENDEIIHTKERNCMHRLYALKITQKVSSKSTKTTTVQLDG